MVRMNIEDLRAFVWVAECGGFSRASAQHRVAQSALSRRVARLESDLGTSLVRRDGRGVRLTEQGQHLHARSGTIFSEIDSVRAEMFELSDTPRGEVKIALPPTTAQVLAPQIAIDARERYPEITLKIWEGFSGAIHSWIGAGDVDLALLYEPEERSDIRFTPLIREPVYLIVSHEKRSAFPALPEKGPLRFSDLPKIPLILPGKRHSIRSLVERMAIERRLKLNISYEVDGIRATKAMVAAGLGCTLFSYAGIYEEVDAGTLEVIETSPPLVWTLNLGEPRHHDANRAVKAIRELVLEKIQALRDGGFWRGRFTLS